MALPMLEPVPQFSGFVDDPFSGAELLWIQILLQRNLFA